MGLEGMRIDNFDDMRGGIIFFDSDSFQDMVMMLRRMGNN